LRLKELTLHAFTISYDEAFHTGHTLLAKLNLRTSSREICIYSFKLCPRVRSFYDMATWHLYDVTVLQSFETAYVKCVKMFSGHARLDSVTSMFFMWIFLRTIGTIIHNVRCRFAACVSSRLNSVIRLDRAFMLFNVKSMLSLVLYYVLVYESMWPEINKW